MSHVDTSIGFSLRSEPPCFSAELSGQSPNLAHWRDESVKMKLVAGAPVVFVISCMNLITRPIEKGWQGWGELGKGIIVSLLTSSIGLGLGWLFYRGKFERKVRAIQAAGFDSPVVQLTAEGRQLIFRFASGLEFADRWDRLLRFKPGAEFTEFEFPANPPIIIPTSSIPEETRAAFAQFCTAEKIPSETNR